MYLPIAKNVLHRGPAKQQLRLAPGGQGAFLERMQAPGATRDWRGGSCEATGGDLDLTRDGGLSPAPWTGS